MKHVHQFLVTRVSLISIGAMLTVPLPAVADGTVYGTSVSLGQYALTDPADGWDNTAIGYRALQHNNATSASDGHLNTAIGSQALSKNTTGHRNTASGSFALYVNTTGRSNTAIGSQALYTNTTGDYNTASGIWALGTNKTGSNNTASGGSALKWNFSGQNNTASGYRAGGFNKSGSNNVFIGYRAGDNVGYSNKSDQLVIANGPLPANQLLIGDFSKRTLLINGRTSISGNANVGGNLKVKGKAFAASFEESDGRLKKDIKPLTHALDSILQLQGKTYRWKEDTTFANKADIGLIAQDVEKVFPEFVAEDEQGYKAIAYSKLTTVLIEAMKEQQGQMISQKQKMTAQQDQIATLEKENTQLKAIVEGQMEDLLARVAMLEGVSLVTN